MKKLNELTFEERKEIATLFGTWLKNYTHEVHIRVMEKAEEIINDDFSMKLLKELHERTEKENRDYMHSIGNLLGEFETFKEYDVHNHPITHANSYRDVLYDLHIRQ